MFFQKGAFLFLLARTAVAFNTFTPQNALVSNNVAFTVQPSNVFALSKPKSLNVLFSEVSDEVSDEATEVTEDVVEEIASEEAESEEAESEEAASEEEDFKIYIGNLSYDFEQDQIEALFAPFGTIKESFVPTDKWSGKPRGFAFITMAGRTVGEAAVEGLHNTQVGGRTIKVNEQLSKEELASRPKRENKRVKEEGTKIYIGNLPFDTERDELNSMFSQYGAVTDCFLPTDRETGRPRGFAFIQMSEDDAKSAIDALDGSDFGGRRIVVNISLPKGQAAPPRAKRVKLYVGNLAFSTEEDEVLSLFSEYGDVIDCYMPRDRETDRPRGFAFVTMGEEDALAAEADCDGFEMDGRALRVNQAQPKGSGDGGFQSNNEDSGSQEGFYDTGAGSTWEDGY